MAKRYRVCMLGCGPRGRDHLHGFRENADRFEVVGLCDRDARRLGEVAREYGIARTYTGAEEMLASEHPDVFCFATMPDARWPLVELGIRHKVGAIAFEKPMALTVAEARRIRDACDAAGVKWVVSHQQKYGAHYQAIKRIVDAGDIGTVHTIHATAQAWLMQLGTHLIDYAIWLNGGHPPAWAIGQAHGAGRFTDSHPSPDYVFGQVAFTNGVRCVAEFGPLAPSFLDDPAMFWVNDSLTAYGSHGYARMILGKGWEAVTRASGGEVISGPGFFNPLEEQPRYMADLARWLDDDAAEHPCSGRFTYTGFEAAMALCLSSLRHRQVALPLDPAEDIDVFAELRPLLADTAEELEGMPP